MEVSITPAAEKFVKRMIRFSEGGPERGMRLVVTAGGCSGLAAEFTVEPAPLEGDAIVTLEGARLFLPAESRILLEGATIDFLDSPLSSGFVFHNAQVACGCSSSSPEKSANPPGVGTVSVSSIGRRH